MLEVSAQTLLIKWQRGEQGEFNNPFYPLKQTLKTIKSPGLLQIVVYYCICDLLTIQSHFVPEQSQHEITLETDRHSWLLGKFCDLGIECDFSLILSAITPEKLGEKAVKRLREFVAAKKAGEGPNAFSHEPLVEYQTRSPSRAFGPW